jgi:hypothetical protein
MTRLENLSPTRFDGVPKDPRTQGVKKPRPKVGACSAVLLKVSFSRTASHPLIPLNVFPFLQNSPESRNDLFLDVHNVLR